MTVICCETHSRKRQSTSGKILLAILAFLTFSSASSLPSKGYECPDCSGQHIKTIDPSTGKCVECWPCTKCPDGLGLSVKCGTTVPKFTKIHCVLCVNGANFSDSVSTDQCQPCGVCAGEHEEVLNKCTRESNVMCDCKAGFYRNKTNDKCLPCSSCPSCLRDKDIFSKCQKDGGEQPMVRSSTTMYSTSLVSSLATSSYSHYATSMSLLPGLTITRVLFPIRTRQISATLTSVLEHEITPTSTATVQVPQISHNVYNNKTNDDHTHKSSSKKTEIIILVFFIMCGCVFLLYCKLKNSRTRRLNDDPFRFSELNQGALEESDQQIKEESGSCETSSNSANELNVDKTHCSENFEERIGSEADLSSSLSGFEGKSNLTADSADQDGRVIVSDHPEHTAAIGIPSSLEDEQKNEQTKGISQGHQSHCHIEDSHDGLPTTQSSSVNMLVCSDHQAALPPSPPNKPFSTSNMVDSSGLTVVKSTEQTSQLPPAIEKDMGSEIANQRAVCGFSVEPPVQSTEDNRGYNTHIKDVPESLILNMCMMLDEERDIDGKDYKLLASELKLEPVQIRYLKELKQRLGKSPSYVLLMQVFSAGENLGTLHHLNSILKKMERFDVIKVLDDWVSNNS